MTLVPAFEIGVWNAWVFMPYLFLATLLVGKFKKGEDPGKTELDAMSKNEKRIFNFSMLVFLFALIFAVFLPLKLGTTWFNVGLPVTLIGLVLFTICMVNYAATPWEEPITKGIYHYSRHPMYITTALFLLGVGIASASWIFLLLTIAYTALQLIYSVKEEQMCLENYGNA